jgi:anti-sigma regulatory factor (Ser/Thr protein kinase)
MSNTSSLRCDEQRFAGEPRAVAEARAFAVAAITRWGLKERTDDLRLCVSELASNAVVHSGSPASDFTLRVIASPHRLRVEVSDDGDGRPVRRQSMYEDTSGRGLLLVDALTDAWGIDDRAVGKIVWAEFVVNGACPA